jgi:aspartyl-tRNA(Asn)/glutamyl-tRNA(Gln) amidotransferase subunit A
MPTLRELQQRMHEREISAGSLLDDSLHSIQRDAQEDGAIYVSVDQPAARQAADTCDALRIRDYVPSALAGLPVSVKDLFDVKGQVTSAGSRVLRDAPSASRDSVAISRLRDAGAVFVGRTNMSEFAYSGLGVNPHYGTPHNPHDRTRVAGGSSSGAAVSVARGHAAWGLGTDTGGSLRIPAAFCGLTAFKPTARRVPLDGVIPLAAAFDSVGAIAASVDCCVIADGILSAQQLNSAPRALGKLRLGVDYRHVVDESDDDVRRAFDRAIGLLREAGVTIVPFDFPELDEALAHAPQSGITAAQAWSWHRRHVEESAHLYDPRVLTRLEKGRSILAADYIDLIGVRERFVAAARRRLSAFDAWLMPTVACVPPLMAPLESDDEAFFAANAAVLRNPSIVNLMDGCALTTPCHSKGELPVGLSIVGSSLADAKVLSIGRSVEALLRENGGVAQGFLIGSSKNL